MFDNVVLFAFERVCSSANVLKTATMYSASCGAALQPFSPLYGIFSKESFDISSTRRCRVASVMLCAVLNNRLWVGSVVTPFLYGSHPSPSRSAKGRVTRRIMATFSSPSYQSSLRSRAQCEAGPVRPLSVAAEPPEWHRHRSRTGGL